MRRITTRLLVLATAGLVLASCGEVTERVTEEAIEQSAGGGEVDIDEDGSVSFENEDGSFSADAEGNLDIESEDGSYSVDSQSGDLPEDFPDVPVPDGFEVRSSSAQSDGDETAYTALGTVDGDAADLLDETIDDYESDGYEMEGQYGNTSGDNFSGGATFVGDDWSVTVGVNGTGGDPANVSVTVVPASQ